jgi:hypothetical protein
MPVIGRRDVPVKRDQVYTWIHYAQDNSLDLEAYISSQLTALGLSDTQVAMGDELGDVPLLGVIMMEVDSYS